MKKEKSEKKEIQGKMLFGEILRKYPESAEIFIKNGMYCYGCPMAMQETLEEGIEAHGLNVKKIIDELNKSIKEN